MLPLKQKMPYMLTTCCASTESMLTACLASKECVSVKNTVSYDIHVWRALPCRDVWWSPHMLRYMTEPSHALIERSKCTHYIRAINKPVEPFTDRLWIVFQNCMVAVCKWHLNILNLIKRESDLAPDSYAQLCKFLIIPGFLNHQTTILLKYPKGPALTKKHNAAVKWHLGILFLAQGVCLQPFKPINTFNEGI